MGNCFSIPVFQDDSLRIIAKILTKQIQSACNAVAGVHTNFQLQIFCLFQMQIFNQTVCWSPSTISG